MTARVERLTPDLAPPTGPFSAELRQGSGPACRFLPAIPRDDEAWQVALEAARAVVHPVSPAAVERIVRRQRALGAGPAAEAAARALADVGTLAVVTGQQPGLLGGVLLAAHKAAGARQLARALEGGPGKRVVSVFWLAGEDHDVDEVNRAFLLDRGGSARRLALELPQDGRSVMHRVVTPAMAAELLASAAELLPDTDRARDLLDRLRLDEPTDLATWGARALALALGDAGIVLLDPRDLLPDAGEAQAALVLEARAIRDAIRSSAIELEAAGLPAPLAPDDRWVPIFLRDEETGPRRRVEEGSDGRLRLRDGTVLGSPAEVAERVAAAPLLASGDVVGRVFVQNRLLPVLAYVGGATELAYHAQVRAAHDAMGLHYPLALPRPEATWVDAKADRTAAAFETTVERLLGDGVSSAPEAITRGDAELTTGLDAWRAALDLPAALTRWRDASPARSDVVQRAQHRLREAFARAEKTLRAHAEREQGIDAGRWTRLTALLRPRGRPQERGLSSLSLLARYGTEAFGHGLEALDPLAPGHHVVHLDGSTL